MLGLADEHAELGVNGPLSRHGLSPGSLQLTFPAPFAVCLVEAHWWQISPIEIRDRY